MRVYGVESYSMELMRGYDYMRYVDAKYDEDDARLEALVQELIRKYPEGSNSIKLYKTREEAEKAAWLPDHSLREGNAGRYLLITWDSISEWEAEIDEDGEIDDEEFIDCLGVYGINYERR